MPTTDDLPQPRSTPTTPSGQATGLAIAMVLTAGLFFDPLALPSEQNEAVQALLNSPDTRVVGSAGICCGAQQR